MVGRQITRDVASRDHTATVVIARLVSVFEELLTPILCLLFRVLYEMYMSLSNRFLRHLRNFHEQTSRTLAHDNT